MFDWVDCALGTGLGGMGVAGRTASPSVMGLFGGGLCGGDIPGCFDAMGSTGVLAVGFWLLFEVLLSPGTPAARGNFRRTCVQMGRSCTLCTCV